MRFAATTNNPNTIYAWKKRDQWDETPPVQRVTQSIDARLIQLTEKQNKTGGDFKEIDLLTRQLKKLHDGQPDVMAAGKKGRAKKLKNHFTLEDVVNHGWKHTDIDEIRDENTEDEFLNLYMCEFVREGESAFNLNILIGCGVDGYDDWKDWKPFALRPMGNRPVWIGYDANGSSGNGDSGAVSVVVPPAVPGGRFRTVETRRVQGLEFEEQARVIEEFTCRYNVEHIGIDVTGGNGEAVYQIVKRFFPAAIPYTFTLSSKRSLVLKMLQIMRAGRWEYDRAERELVAAFNAVRKVKTPGGFITYETDRARGISHGDLAWATMLAVINEPIGGEGENERFTVMEF
ncbi:terminase [Escherichia coli]|nr:terminase [Escherichia coli]EIG1457028.1 terminase [Escherichia coli]